eukprot:COSAG05_NODE_20142_length_282_cov_1.136612_1_plen_38_part_01
MALLSHCATNRPLQQLAIGCGMSWSVIGPVNALCGLAA